MRATSTSIDPNVLGGLLILVTSLATPQFFASRPIVRKAWLSPILATLLACLVLTFSRGAFLGLGVALLFIALARYRRLLWLMLAVGLVILLLPQTQQYVRHFQEGLAGQDLATQMRMGEYKDALTLISRYPWFGVGFLGAPTIDLYIGVSSVYLLMAEEMGLVGLSAFLLLMAVFFGQTLPVWRGMAIDDRLQPVLLGLLAALIGALVGGLFDHYFFNLDFPHSVALFWLYMGLAMVAVRLGKQTPGD